MRRRIPILVATLFFLGFFLRSDPSVRANTPARQIIMVLWHGLSWEDIQTLAFEEPAAWGFLNVRSGGGETLSGAYLSISAGARAAGYNGAASFASNMGGQELYRLHTGQNPSAIVQPSIAFIQQAQKMDYLVKPGALGSALSDGGLTPRVLGNSDGEDSFHWAALIAMDHFGRVQEGSIGSEFTLLDLDYPYGVRTDYDGLATAVRRAEEPLVVVDLGDPFRYDQYQTTFLLERRIAMQSRMVQEALEFLEAVLREKPSNSILLVVSPYPPKHLADQGYWLTPVLCLGWKQGLLVSGTTRWPGLITNMDIAPTILELLGVQHQQPMVGRPAVVQVCEDAVTTLHAMEKRVGVLTRYRSPILRALVIGQIVVYTITLLSLILNAPLPHWVTLTLRISLLIFLTLPLVLLLGDRLKFLGLVLVLGAAFVGLRNFNVLLFMGTIAFLTVLWICGDVLTGSWMMRYSILGYDPIGGARFYGLGNEFMGILVGTAVMGWAVWAERLQLSATWRNIAGLFFFVPLILLIGAPSLGTNVGGAICAVFAFGTTWFAFTGKKLGLGKIWILILAVGALLGVLILLDGGNPKTEQSHIGQSVGLFQRDGLGALFLIIRRKLAMNFKLMRYSIWSRGLLVALAVMGASSVWPSKFLSWLKKNHPLVAKGIGGVAAGSIAAFLFNDSGVVAAATCLTFASATLLLLALNLKTLF